MAITIIPRPGRLPVTYRTSLGRVTEPLIQVPTGEMVTADVTITELTRHDGRATLALTATDGMLAGAQVDADTLRKFAGLIIIGARLTVRGIVRRLPDGMPLIDTRAAFQG